MKAAGEGLRFQPQPEVLGGLVDQDLTRLEEILPAAFGAIEPSDVAKFIPLAIIADSAEVLVSRNQDGHIASVMIVNVDYGAGKLRGRIDDVATHRDSQRQGHAGTVLDFAIDWFRQRGVTRISLTSSNQRLPAHGLYFSRGFEIHDTNQFQLDL